MHIRRLLANLMLPDGAEKHLEDWTIFFLNQTHFNTVEPVLVGSPDSNGRRTPRVGAGYDDQDGDGPTTELLYVLNLVRTKQDPTVPRYVSFFIYNMKASVDFRVRGALVKAMAICTRHPFIQIFKVRSMLFMGIATIYRGDVACAVDGFGRLFHNPFSGLSRAALRCGQLDGYLWSTDTYSA